MFIDWVLKVYRYTTHILSHIFFNSGITGRLSILVDHVQHHNQKCCFFYLNIFLTLYGRNLCTFLLADLI